MGPGGRETRPTDPPGLRNLNRGDPPYPPTRSSTFLAPKAKSDRAEPKAKAEKVDKKKAHGPAGERPRCGLCGHWSVATEYGVDDRSGYCDRWEKLTDRDFVCDEFVSREKFQAMQKELAEQHEEYLDEDTG